MPRHASSEKPWSVVPPHRSLGSGAEPIGCMRSTTRSGDERPSDSGSTPPGGVLPAVHVKKPAGKHNVRPGGPPTIKGTANWITDLIIAVRAGRLSVILVIHRSIGVSPPECEKGRSGTQRERATWSL